MKDGLPRLRIFQTNWDAPVWASLGNPVAWTLIALILSSIGLYLDLR